MGKYERYNRTAHAAPRPWRIHPIWRGIGCVMLVIIPIISYAGAVLLVEENSKQGWVVLPREVLRTIYLPVIGNYPRFLAVSGATIVLMLIGFGLMVVLYGLMYQLIGPPRLGPTDAPPMRRKTRRSR